MSVLPLPAFVFIGAGGFSFCLALRFLFGVVSENGK